MRVTLLSASFVLAVWSGAAAETLVNKGYSYTDHGFASRDAACVAAMLEKITPNFDGLQQVMLTANSIVQTQSGYLATYPGAKFESVHGDAEGSLSCIFDADGRHVTEVSVAFEGRGLAGFTRHPLGQIIADPAQQLSTGMSSSIIRN